MWRIYTSWDNVSTISRLLFEERIFGLCIVEVDVYLTDDAYGRVLDYVQSHDDFGDFSSEYVPLEDFEAIIDTLKN